jgi:hypothetical protein
VCQCTVRIILRRLPSTLVGPSRAVHTINGCIPSMEFEDNHSPPSDIPRIHPLRYLQAFNSTTLRSLAPGSRCKRQLLFVFQISVPNTARRPLSSNFRVGADSLASSKASSAVPRSCCAISFCTSKRQLSQNWRALSVLQPRILRAALSFEVQLRCYPAVTKSRIHEAHLKWRPPHNPSRTASRPPPHKVLPNQPSPHLQLF